MKDFFKTIGIVKIEKDFNDFVLPDLTEKHFDYLAAKLKIDKVEIWQHCHLPGATKEVVVEIILKTFSKTKENYRSIVKELNDIE